METRRHFTRVLLVEADQHDDRLIRDSLSKIAGEKYELDHVMGHDAARDALVRGSYDLCLFSLGSEGGNDHGLVDEIGRVRPNMPIILILNCREKISAAEPIRTKVADTLTAEEIHAGLLERSMRYAIDRTASKAALDKSCARMQAILDNMPAGVILLEGEPARPVMINRKGEQLLGRRLPASTTGSGLASCRQAYRAGTVEFLPIEGKLIVRAMAGERAFADDVDIRRPDGSRVRLEVLCAPVRDTSGRISGAVAVYQDITERKEAEEVLCVERDLALELVGSSASLNKALEILLDACLKMDHLDCGGIYLVEPENAVLRLVCHRGLSADFVRQVSLFDLTSPQGCFVMQGEPGYWGDPVDLLEMKDLLREEGLTALAAIPVKSDGEVVALLNVASHTRTGIPLAVRAALERIAAHLGEVLSRARLGETIKAQSERLEETNAALRVLLRQREQDRAEMEESLLSNVRHLVMPCLEKLKGGRLADDQRLLMDVLESHLKGITAPFVRRIAAPTLGLTPREIRVAELIRQGMSSQEIADLLVISRSAVIFHRQGIRRKLGLIGKRVNLQAYLATLAL